VTTDFSGRTLIKVSIMHILRKSIYCARLLLLLLLYSLLLWAIVIPLYLNLEDLLCDNHHKEFSFIVVSTLMNGLLLSALHWVGLLYVKLISKLRWSSKLFVVKTSSAVKICQIIVRQINVIPNSLFVKSVCQMIFFTEFVICRIT